mmetsp:Transcript_130100/g.250761  ORF Transcript_130100/g.250761 Transcript_130100/m.250761 type:complete len:358 (-) Transcript_130100:51-1124(-)
MVLPEEGVPTALPTERQVKRFFLKTQLCRFFSNNQCTRGQECSFAHGMEELRTFPNLTKTALCKAWQSNQCSLTSEQCQFAHGLDELRSHREQLRRQELRRILPDLQKPVHAHSGVSEPKSPSQQCSTKESSPQHAGKSKTSAATKDAYAQAGGSSNTKEAREAEPEEASTAEVTATLPSKRLLQEPKESMEARPDILWAQATLNMWTPAMLNELVNLLKPMRSRTGVSETAARPQQQFSTRGHFPQDPGSSKTSVAAKAYYQGADTHVTLVSMFGQSLFQQQQRVAARGGITRAATEFVQLPGPVQRALLSVASVHVVREGVSAGPTCAWLQYLRSIKPENLSHLLLASMPQEYED